MFKHLLIDYEECKPLLWADGQPEKKSHMPARDTRGKTEASFGELSSHLPVQLLAVSMQWVSLFIANRSHGLCHWDASFLFHASILSSVVSVLSVRWCFADKNNPLWNLFSEKLGVSLKFRGRYLLVWSKARKKNLSTLSTYLLSVKGGLRVKGHIKKLSFKNYRKIK